MMEKRILNTGSLILLVLKRFTPSAAQTARSADFPIECSQPGIAARIGISLMAVSKAMRRLLKDEFISIARCRVRGRRYRRNIYILTSKGQTAVLQAEGHALGMKFQIKQMDGTVMLVKGSEVVKATDFSITDVVLAGIRSKYGIISLESPVAPRSGNRKYIHGSVPRIKHFAGRKRELQNLKNTIRRLGVCALEGLAGIGKTSLTAAAVPSLAEEFNIFWFEIQPSSTLGEIQNEVTTFSTYVGGRISGASALKASGLAFRISEKLGNIPIIFIFDDVHNASENVLLFIESLLWFSRNSSIKSLLLCRSLPKRLVPYVSGKISLQGVDLSTASEITGLPEYKVKDVCVRTAGHPLLLQRMREDIIPGFFSSHDVRNYIYREFYSHLSAGEREVLKFLSVVRKPVFIPATPESEALENENVIIRDLKGRFHAHEILKEYVRGLLDENERKNLNRKACEYYMKIREPDKLVELIYHMTESRKFDKAANIILKNWEKFLNRGYSEELVHLVVKLPSLTPELSLVNARFLNEIARWGDSYSVLKGLVDSDIPSSLRINALTELAEVCISMSRFTEGRKYAENALSLARGKSRIGSLYALYKIFMLKEQEKRAVNYLKDLSKVCSRYGIASRKVSIMVARGFLEFTHNNFTGSIRHWMKAYRYFSRIRNLRGLSTVCNNIGSAMVYLGKYKQAARYLEKAASIHEDLGNPVDLARTHINLANCYLRLGEVEKARLYAAKASRVFEKVRVNKSFIALLHETLGKIETHVGNIGAAATHFSQGEKLTLDSDDEAGAIANILGLSYLDFLRGRNESAVRLAGEALRLSKKKNDDQNVAYSMLLLGRYMGGRLPHKADRLLMSAAVKFRRIGDFHGYQSSQCAIASLKSLYLDGNSRYGKTVVDAYKNCLKESLKSNDAFIVIEALLGLCSVLSIPRPGSHGMSSTSLKLKYSERALELAKHCESKVYIAFSLLALGDALKEAGRETEAASIKRRGENTLRLLGVNVSTP